MKINGRGFWENETDEGHGYDKGLCDALINFFQSEQVDSVIDMGCGSGYYTKELNDNGIRTLGVDGNPNTPAITHGLCKVADLTVTQDLGLADWVLSLEVGEHIPQEYQQEFIANLDRHNKLGIVLSWAVRGQGGDGHVNCLDNTEVIDLITPLGYRFEAGLSQWLRNRCATYPNTGWWFRNTVMVFRRNIQTCTFGYIFSEG